MAIPHPIVPSDFTLTANKDTDSIDIALEAASGTELVRLQGADAFELATMILAALPHIPYPELEEDLQQFALREIKAQEVSGAIFLAYRLENGMAFGSAPGRDRLEALHQQLGTLLAKLPAANIITPAARH